MSQAPGPGQGYYSYEIISDQPTYEQAIKPLGSQGSGFPGILMGIGALGEGIGNLVRGIRGEAPAPPGLATQKLYDYLNPDKQDSSLAALLEKLLTERKDDVELAVKSGSTDISKAGNIYS